MPVSLVDVAFSSGLLYPVESLCRNGGRRFLFCAGSYAGMALPRARHSFSRDSAGNYGHRKFSGLRGMPVQHSGGKASGKPPSRWNGGPCSFRPLALWALGGTHRDGDMGSREYLLRLAAFAIRPRRHGHVARNDEPDVSPTALFHGAPYVADSHSRPPAGAGEPGAIEAYNTATCRDLCSRGRSVFAFDYLAPRTPAESLVCGPLQQHFQVDGLLRCHASHHDWSDRLAGVSAALFRASASRFYWLSAFDDCCRFRWSSPIASLRGFRGSDGACPKRPVSHCRSFYLLRQL